MDPDRHFIWHVSYLTSLRLLHVDKYVQGISYLFLGTVSYGKHKKNINTESFIGDTLNSCLELIQPHWDKFRTYPICWVKLSVGSLSKYTYPLDTKLPGRYFVITLDWLPYKGHIYLITPIHTKKYITLCLYQ